jgi:hypothetical protein
MNYLLIWLLASVVMGPLIGTILADRVRHGWQPEEDERPVHLARRVAPGRSPTMSSTILAVSADAGLTPTLQVLAWARLMAMTSADLVIAERRYRDSR